MSVALILAGSVLMYVLLALSFIIKNYTLGMLSGMGILCIGIYVAIYNIENIDNLLTQAFGLISISLGMLVFIKGSLEKIEELM